MPQPTPYTPGTDYSDELTTSAVPGTHGEHLDQEFNRVKTCLDGVLTNLALIQRDDGAIQNAKVTPDSFNSAALALMAGGWFPRGDWVTSTVYEVGDVVEHSGGSYVAAVEHTAGVFATDDAAGKWITLFGAGSAASGISFSPTGTIAATDTQSAIAEVAIDAAASLSAHTGDATDAHAASAITNTPAGNIVATTVQAAINELDAEKQSASDVANYLSSAFTANNGRSRALNTGMVYGTLFASRSGGAEFVFILNQGSTTPSSIAPVIFNAPDTVGGFSSVSAIASLSLTIPSGATLGANDGVAFRLWVVVFNDAGTLRVGVVNTCIAGNATFPLRPNKTYSSTAISTGSDSAGVIYTAVAVTDCPLTVVGYMDYTLTTAGTWGSAPALTLYSPGVALPGQEIQSVISMSRTYTAAGTAMFPADDTIPQGGEANALTALDVSITPTSAINFLDIDTVVIGGSSAGTSLSWGAAIFQNGTADALERIFLTQPANTGAPITGSLSHRKVAGAVTSLTFNVRAGVSGGNNFSFNGYNGASLYGGLSSHNRVREIQR